LVVSTLLDEYLLVAKELFDKNLINIGLGSISMKLKADKMVINKKNKHVNEEDFIKTLHILREDMAWEEATEDVKVHSKIYEQVPSAKAIVHIFPKNVIAFSLMHHKILKPLDFLAKETIGNVNVIEIHSLQEWHENKEFIIAKELKHKDIVIIKGHSAYVKGRDLREILKKSIILENSAYMLLTTR
jgi:L-fuculose-phosphate aldolase